MFDHASNCICSLDVYSIVSVASQMYVDHFLGQVVDHPLGQGVVKHPWFYDDSIKICVLLSILITNVMKYMEYNMQSYV